MRYLLYNPLSGKSNQSYEEALHYSERMTMPTKLINLTSIYNVRDFFETLESDEDVVIFGGDGSLNKIANEIFAASIQNDIYYYPCGTGNDFARDIGATDTREPVLINDYIKNLPTVTVNGKQSKFINGVGFGIDGYCCEIGDRLKSQHQNPNYTSIAIKGLLFHYKPVNAIITVDGEEKCFKKVWIAPTMFGRYYGGGMMPTPEQDRNAEGKTVSLMVFHGSGKLKTLMIFPSLFKGTHTQQKKNVTILRGKNITVDFDRPTSLQIDGETMLNITRYNVSV